METGDAMPLKTLDPIMKLFAGESVAFDGIVRGDDAGAKRYHHVTLPPRCPPHISLEWEGTPAVRVVVFGRLQHGTSPFFAYQPHELGILLTGLT
jgi:hypothetical protein